MSEPIADNHLPVTAILAGGLATRLGAIASSVPKSMMPVAGEPFLAHQLRQLTSEGVTEVVICAGHLASQIEQFAGDGAAFGCRIRYSLDGEQLLGTGGALRHALPLLGERFLVMYGDSYLIAPFLPAWQAFLRSSKSALMTVFRNQDRWDRSNVEIADGTDQEVHDILRYDKTIRDAHKNFAMRHIDYGLGCIRSEALSSFTAEERFDLASFYSAMAERRQLAGFEVQERFYEIGSTEGLAETDRLLSQLAARAAKSRTAK